MQLRARKSLSAIVIGGAATIISALPTLLTGALAPKLAESLAFSVAGLGTAFAIQSGVGALVSAPMGRYVDRLGVARSIRLAMLVVASVAFLIATAARTYSILVVLLVFSAIGNRLIEPATNRLLVEDVNPKRLGLAFGLKQSAPPIALVLAGLSVPTVAAIWGWRGAFGLASVLALSVAGVVWRRASPPRRAAARPMPDGDDPVTEPETDARSLLILSLAFGFANAASSTIPVFYVTAAVATGTSASTAGLTIAIASSVAGATRLLLGVVADRMFTGHLRLCGIMLASGAVGFVMLASGRAALATIGVVLALAAAWGFSGLFWFTLVRSNPNTAGAVSGRVAPGALVASSASPLIFGLIAQNAGFLFGWAFAAVMAILAAAFMFLGERSMARARAAR
jgi:predicted MFS family arabinose efflux permease